MGLYVPFSPPPVKQGDSLLSCFDTNDGLRININYNLQDQMLSYGFAINHGTELYSMQKNMQARGACI